MSCDIIEPGYVQIDGSDYYLGGAIGGATFNFSDLSSQSTADITLYETGSGLTTPSQGSSVTVTVMDYTWTMTVSKYTFSSSAKGATQMRVTLTDTSHWSLDQDFIVLNEEFPAANVNSNCHTVGGKYGTLPEDKLLPSYIMTPNSDTKYGHLRAWFSTLKFGLVVDEASGNAPLPKLLTVDDVDNLTETTPGKAMYWTNQSSPYVEDLFYGYDTKEILIEDKSLYDILGEDGLDLLGESCYDATEDGTVVLDAEGKKTSLFPNIEMQEVGSLRSVMTSFANKLGWMCYWDMENQKIELVSSIDTADGQEKMSKIKETCFVTAASSSADFTTTSWEGAVGSVISSNPGQAQSSGGAGGDQSKYLYASILKPEFSYRSCSNPLEGEEGGFGGARTTLATPYVEYMDKDKDRAQLSISDVGEAITVALADEDQWPRFVAEQVLKKNIIDGENITNSERWPKDACKKATTHLIGSQGFADLNVTYNKFITDYYMDSTTAKTDMPCSTDLYEIQVSDDKTSTYMDTLFGYGDTGPLNQEAFNAVGKWDKEKMAFEHGRLCAYVLKKRADMPDVGVADYPLDAILGAKGFVKGVDALRNYLRAVGDFFSRFYVVTSSGYNTARTAKFGRDYGYLVTSSASSSGMNITCQEGFKVVQLKPFHSVADCGNATISKLAKALAQSYCSNLGYDGLPTIEGLLANITTIDFIYALDNARKVSQAGTNAISIAKEPVNATTGDDKVNPPRKDNLEKLFVDGKNRFDSDTADSLRTDDDAGSLMMILLERDKAAMPLESETTPGTIVFGGMTVTQQAQTTPEDQTDIFFMNQSLNSFPSLSPPKCREEAPTINLDDEDPYLCLEEPEEKGGELPPPNENGCISTHGFWCCESSQPLTDFVSFFAISSSRPWPVGGAGGGTLNFFKSQREIFELERAPSSARAWFKLSGSRGEIVSNDAGAFYMCEGSIPEKNKDGYWKGSLNMGISLDAADISLANTIAMDYGSKAGSASAYSAANKVLMRSSLSSKVATNVAAHSSIGSSNTVSIIVGDKMESEDPDSGLTEDLELPTWKEGLESISISSSQGKTVVGITVGNKLLMRAVKAALDMRSTTSTFQHQQTKHVADPFRNSIGQGFYNKST
tara:strand:+ start:2881 stop:6261 length:3381 start_codon:yes stop_codon:yes gene_type:complete